MQIKIALLVGSNGKAAVATDDGDGIDWGFMADCIMDYELGSDAVDPEASAKYFVTVEVPLPQVGEAAGTVEVA